MLIGIEYTVSVRNVLKKMVLWVILMVFLVQTSTIDLQYSLVCDSPKPLVLVIVHSSIYATIELSLNQYVADVENEGFSVDIIETGQIQNETPQGIRSYLQSAMNSNLVGVLFVGDIPEVWQEALRIPAIKVYEKGKLRKDVWDLIFANIRFDIVKEDLKAQIGACTVGERRVKALLEKYGIESFEAHKEFLFESTRKMMETEIRKIPAGVYQGEAIVYYDGWNPGSKFTIRVKIEVSPGKILFDFSRSVII